MKTEEETLAQLLRRINDRLTRLERQPVGLIPPPTPFARGAPLTYGDLKAQ